MNNAFASTRRAIPASPRFHFIAGALVVLTFLTVNIGAGAQTEKTLYSFNGTTGAQPFGLAEDALGNFYGASTATTTQKYGSIYRLAKGPSGHWNMTVLYVFKGLRDGKYPNAKLVVDSAGNLYGTTAYEGGIRDCSCGTVFELSPTASGPWKETTLYSFQGGSDGAEPFAGPAWDSAGNLYGTTYAGGQADLGTVFELSPVSGGGWTENTIHSFQGGSDGLNPSDPVALDQSGNIYGTTETGGGQGSCGGTGDGCGVVFEVMPNSGSWSESILYTFNGDLGVPTGGLAFDQYGDIYGVTNRGGYLSLCGGLGCGTVFQLYTYQGSWEMAFIYGFQDLTDGAFPYGGLAVSKMGETVYGTATSGGTYSSGTVFKVSNTNAGWTEETLYDFAGGTDGAYPYGNLILDTHGNLYGTTTAGGIDNQGTIFKLFP